MADELQSKLGITQLKYIHCKETNQVTGHCTLNTTAKRQLNITMLTRLKEIHTKLLHEACGTAPYSEETEVIIDIARRTDNVKVN